MIPIRGSEPRWTLYHNRMIWDTRAFLIAAIAGTLLGGLTACGGSSAAHDEAETKETGSDVNTTGGALSAYSNMAKDLEKAAKEMSDAPATPKDPVHFSKLVEKLPAAPSGWERSEPEGSTTDMGGMKGSQARARYTQGDQSVEVEVIDTAFHQALVLPFQMARHMSQESTSGYSKGLEIGGDPAREEWDKKSRNAKRTILVGKRFLLQIEGRNIEPETLQDWTERLDLGTWRQMAAE